MAELTQYRINVLVLRLGWGMYSNYNIVGVVLKYYLRQTNIKVIKITGVVSY